MERLYLPPSLRYLEPMRLVRGETMDHAAFTYDLVAALRPRLLVDVGTGAGTWLAACCQSMRDHDIDGLAHGIDTWHDDEAKEKDDETRWGNLNAFLRAYFRGIAYLLKMSPDDAVPHFADGSIDVLRLNFNRLSTAPLESLIERWLPRVAPGGVLLCDGVRDPGRPDTAEAWARATEGRDAVVFPGGNGLGVLIVAEGADLELLELLTSREPGVRESLLRFYQHADRHHTIRAEVNGQRAAPRRAKP